jgi:hypothetical protein
MSSAALDPLLAVDAVRPAAAPRQRIPEWATGALVGGGLVLGWVAAVLVAESLDPGAQTHSIALFVHLASLVAGFGAVMVIDWTGLLWVCGRRTFLDVTRTADALHLMIWLGLAGLTVSGILLRPDACVTLTRIKLALVLVIAINGLYAHTLAPQLVALGEQSPLAVLSQRSSAALMHRAGAAAMVSQAAWWASMAIGFHNHG